MRPWKKLTNDELALHLELWLEVDGRVATDWQREYFEEIIWRLRLIKEENDSQP